MRIGILTDIHEALEPPRRALSKFRGHRVDAVVSLGDACDTLRPIDRASAIVRLLQEAGAIGVWGNHDMGLSVGVPEPLRQSIAPAVLEYFAGMQPHLVLAGCRFSHVEPWLDPHKVEDMWHFDGLSDTPERVARSFAAVPEQYLFLGHFHQWLVMTPSGQVEWSGTAPLTFAYGQRYLVAVAPVVSGWCAVLDTGKAQLLPVRCAV
jgi:hypothetical protein